MDQLVTALRAAAEPTRLRLLALVERGAFCVVELTEILGQSQPRLSRHLKLLCDAGLLERSREGANVWFSLAAGSLVRDVLAHIPADDRTLAADRRHAARVMAERARVASESFRRQGADWDELRALDLPAARIEAAIWAHVPQDAGRLVDIGTGTGRLLEFLAPRISAGLGIDASRAMVALARARLSKPALSHCQARLGDMYRLPLADRSQDVAVLHMVLHHAEDPQAAILEAARVLRAGGHLLVIDLCPHDRRDLTARLAHCWHGFSDDTMRKYLHAAGLIPGAPDTIDGQLITRVWPATMAATASAIPASTPAPEHAF